MHTVVTAVAAAGLALASVATAAPAAAQHPGQNGIISYGFAAQQFGVPCMGFIYDSDPGPLTRVPEGGRAYSADGRYAAVVSTGPYDDGFAGRYLTIVDTQDCDTWWDLPAVDADTDLSWSPDGSEIAAIRDGDVVVVSVATGETVRRVTRTADVSESRPVWSPKGNMIAFTGVDGVRVAPSKRPARVGERGRLLVADAVLADYSPDGKRIAYLRDGVLHHAKAANGRHEVRVTGDDMHLHAAVWSPDGRYFGVSGDIYDPRWGTPDIACAILRVDGSLAQRLPSESPCSMLAWQPLPSRR